MNASAKSEMVHRPGALVEIPEGISRKLVKEMAADVGKSLAAYVEVMFPEIWHRSKAGFKISLRNHVYNDIVSLADLHDEAAIRKRLADNEAHRKRWVGAYRKMRRKKCEHGIREYECGLCDDARRNVLGQSGRGKTKAKVCGLGLCTTASRNDR